MIVDTSAVVAILRDEPEAVWCSRAIEAYEPRLMSAATLVGVGAVIDGSRDPIASRQLDALLTESAMRIEPVTERQARLAREAYRDFGKSSGHRAGLNFGDCFSYALAKDVGQPLLFTGRDFVHTDVARVELD